MSKTYLFVQRMIAIVFLTSINLSFGWKVKVVNLTTENITVDVKSSQGYRALKKPLSRKCEFIGERVGANTVREFNYRNVKPICFGACTQSVSITSPVQLSAENKLSCSKVVVIVSKDASGKWKIEYHDWATNIANIAQERTEMPVNVRKIYEQFSKSPIQALSVFRMPIQSGVKELMTVLTNKQLKKLNYDTLYHTGFIITCNGKLIKLERNETVVSTIITAQDIPNDMVLRDITLPAEINYDVFIDSAMANDPSFWRYDPINNNCQLFVLQCLKKNKIPISKELHAFIYQDAAQVLSKNPLLKGLAKGATSLANRIDNVLHPSVGYYND